MTLARSPVIPKITKTSAGCISGLAVVIVIPSSIAGLGYVFASASVRMCFIGGFKGESPGKIG